MLGIGFEINAYDGENFAVCVVNRNVYVEEFLFMLFGLIEGLFVFMTSYLS